MTEQTREAVIDALGGLIAHLHVPRSLGSVMVPPEYDKVRDLIGDFGWSSPEEIAARLRAALGTAEEELGQTIYNTGLSSKQWTTNRTRTAEQEARGE